MSVLLQDQRQPIRRYALAVLTVAIAAGIAYHLEALVYPSVLPPFILAVVIAAAYGGNGPGLLACLLSAGVLSQWFLFSADGATAAAIRRLVMFLAVGTAAILVVGNTYRQRWGAVRQARENGPLRRAAEHAASRAADALTRQVDVETALRQSEAELSDFFETASVSMHWVDEEGIIVRANQAELDLLGYDRGEYVGHHIAEFHVDTPVIHDLLHRLRSGERVHRYPARLRCKSGQVKDVLIDSSVYSRDGRFVHTRCFMYDVTVEQQAHEAMTRLAAIVASSSDAIVGKTLDGIVTSWNEAAERIFGYTASEMVGQSIFLLIPRELHDTERELLERLRHGEVVEFAEAERIKKGGERIWISLSVSPIRDRLGAITGAASIKRDITEQKRAEAEHRQNQEQLRLAHQAARLGTWHWDVSMGVFRTDEGLRHLYGVEAGTTATSYDDFIQWVHPDDRERVDDTVQRSLNGSGTLDHEFRIIRSDGEVRWLANLGRVGTASGGKPLYLTGVCLDVTERKVMENRLRDTQRLHAVGQLAGGIAHEANNQMTIVLGAAGFLLRRDDLTASTRDDVEQIRRAAERTASITQQLLAFSRRQVLQLRDLDLNAVIRSVEAVLRRSLSEDQQLETRLRLGNRLVRADSSQLDQVLLNLTLNARDAMPNGGRLTIETAEVDITDAHAAYKAELPAGTYAAIIVRDTGHGMDQATLQRIFEPFFTTKDVGQGTGLGLAVVHGIVSQTGGYVGAESAPDNGTTFTLYFPITSSSVTSTPEPVTLPLLGHGKIVLVAEDDAAVRLMVRRSLMEAGYTVLEAANGEAALTVIRSHPARIDIVITDVGMPEMTGHELATCIHNEWPHIPILVISGYGDVVTTKPFLQKPFTPDALVHKVGEVLMSNPEMDSKINIY